MSDEKLVLLDVEGGIATVTLNRPKKLNALNRAVLEALAAAFNDLADRSDVGVVILTGAGDKAFAAGADIGELAELAPVAAEAHSRLGQSVLSRIEGLGKPVIAAINGYALGGGCELAMAASLRLAADNAVLGLPEVSLGLMPGFAGTQRLARLIGKPRALELILTGRQLKAAEAAEFGLVNRVVGQSELLSAARTLAGEILASAPVAVSYALEAVNRGLEVEFEQGQKLEATLFGLLFSTDDMKEGTRAFLDKRAPKFSGR